MNYIPGMGPLSKATSSDKSPVPGHLLRDIAQMTHESLEQCDKVEHYLTKRLSNKNPQVLAKTLRVIKYVAIQGRSEFKRDFQRDAGSIKDLLHYRGPTDPMTGDAPSRTVRETAKEALEAIYSEDTPAAQAATFSTRMKGVGSHAPVAPEPESSGKAAVMNAVGSAVGGSMRIFGGDKGTGQSSKPVESGVGSMPSSFGRSPGGGGAPPGAAGAPDGWSFASNRGGASWGDKESYSAPRAAVESGGRDPHSASRRGSSDSAGRTRGSVGGGWGSVTSAGITGAAPATGGQPSSPAAARVGGAASRGFGSGSGSGTSGAGRAATDGSYERTLVEEVTAPGGMSMAPPPHTLRRFLAGCKTLDAGAIVPLLMARVSDGAQPPQVAAKALHVIDTMLHDPSLHGYGESFAAPEHVRTLRAAAAHPKAQVRNRAAKLLEVLEDDDASVGGRSRRGSTAHGESLLGFDDGDHGAAGPTAGGGGGLDGMFAGLSVENGGANGGGGGGGDSGFSFLQEGQSDAPSGGGGGGGESGFSFLDQGTAGASSGPDDMLGGGGGGGESGFSFLGNDSGSGGGSGAPADDPFSALAAADDGSGAAGADGGDAASGFDFLGAGDSGQAQGRGATGMHGGGMQHGGTGMGGMPQSSMLMGGMQQGGMGMGGMQHGGMGMGGMPQSSMPMGGMQHGGMGMGGMPQSSMPMGGMQHGGMGMGGMPQSSMPMGGMPQGGMGMPQGGLGMGGMTGLGGGPATSPIKRSPAKKAASGKEGKQAAPKEPDSFDFVGDLLNANK